jgi:hypothetical protein
MQDSVFVVPGLVSAEIEPDEEQREIVWEWY